MSMKSIGALILTSLALVALPSTALAQSAAQMPLEGCSPPAVNRFVGNPSCSGSDSEVFNAGEGNTVASTFGTVERQILMPSVSPGLLGVASLYFNLLVVDASLSAWTGAGTHLKAPDGEELPVPYTGPDALVGEGFGLQPRIGSMPGQYIYQVGSTFHQYGSPVDTGANPQTTAVYTDSGDAPTFLTNNLSGAQLWLFLASNYIEVRHVDGTVARFQPFQAYAPSYTPPPNTQIWRLMSVRDPYDNIATYGYNPINQLESITFPSGLSQHFNWSGPSNPTPPTWPGWSSSHDIVEISYKYNGASPGEVAARTWGLVFENNTTGAFVNRHFGGRLFRTYSARRDMLVDLASPGPYSVGAGSVVAAQVIHEFAYNSSTRVMTETHRVHSGAAFDNSLTIPSNLLDKQILETKYGTDGRIVEQTRSMIGETLLFSYPLAQRANELLGEDAPHMRAIQVVNAMGTTRRYEYSFLSGRLYSTITTPAITADGRPRAAHVTTENNGIGGVASTDIEPEWMETYDIYDGTCVCRKPVMRREYSRWGGQTHTRTWEFTYDPDTKLLLTRKAPNPEAGPGGPFPPVQWTYTYAQLVGSGNWGAWVMSTEITPDGTYTYSYSDLLNRAVSGHGQIARTMTRSLSGVRIQDTLTNPPATSGTPVVETTWRNLSNLPGGLPQMGNVKGQLRKTIDGDGVETVYEYSASGYETATIVGGSIKTTFTPDSLGELTSVTENALSALPATTSIVRIIGAGAVASMSSTSAGVLRESKRYYDRFGHLTVTQQNNLASTPGTKPSRHAGSGASARDWVETQHHYHHARLMETYVDRKPLDEAAGSGQFLVTQYNYASDGRLNYTVNPNGSTTWYTFDGFGTLYRSITKDGTGNLEVRSPKRFINAFLEVTGSYEFTATGPGKDHLWTLIARNGAGAITQIQEPSLTTAPDGYTHSTGGAIHKYELDKLARVTKAESYSGTTVLTRRNLRHDQLDRQIWQHDEVLGFGSGDQHIAWEYFAGKATQLASVEQTGIAPTTYTFDAMGLLDLVRDGFTSPGNTTDYSYHTGTPFLQKTERTDLDPLGPARVTATSYGVNALGEVTTVTELGPNHPAHTQLVHTYAYNSLGRVDRYTDPKTRLQKFLPDGLGRIVEHVRVGSVDAITNSTVFEDFGVGADTRTKVSRYDDLGNVTITHTDFAGRPFIVQNPGGDSPPDATSKNKSMCLYAEYDGASRLSALYDGDLGKTEFLRDGPGRVIRRRLVNQVIGGKNSEDYISQWNTVDWLRRDAIGRIQEHDYWGTPTGGTAMGLEQFDQDSLRRVHVARFVSAFAPTHYLEVSSTYNSGNPFRSDLEYQDNMAQEAAHMTYAHDAIGRLSEVQWDKAPGASGAMAILAQYGWAGGLRRTRTVRYGNTAFPQGTSTFKYDDYGRLEEIKDEITKLISDPPPVYQTTLASQFKYEYDAASNLTKEKYAKVGGRVGDRFAYDAYHRLSQAWMGVDAGTMNATNDPTTFNASQIQEHLTYSLDDANNRDATSSQTASSSGTTSYTIQTAAHPQGASNRYKSIQPPGAIDPTVLEYDERGNLKYDGRFVYRYDYMNRLQEVWRVIPHDPGGDGDSFAVVEEGALENAQGEVKLEVPDLYTRLPREHTNPTFRDRLRATIEGGVVRITPTPQGGGCAPHLLPWYMVPEDADLVLAAVYVYDAFNRRTLSILVDPSVGETHVHTWDGWQQVVQHKLEQVGGTWQATPTKQFVWGGKLDELVAYRRKNGANWENYYLLHGSQDTAAKLVDTNGNVVEQYEYDPYGRVTVYDAGGALVDLGPQGASPEDGTASKKGLPFLWKSIRLDDVTGLLYMRNRYYSVEMGRFLTNDPLGTWSDEVNVGNQYAYAGDNPLSYADPFGEKTTIPCPGSAKYSLKREGGIFGPRFETHIYSHPRGHMANAEADKENSLKDAAKDNANKNYECGKCMGCGTPCKMQVSVGAVNVDWKRKVRFVERANGRNFERWWFEGRGDIEVVITCSCSPEEK